MKKYYLLATALAALVSCSENEFIGDNNLGEANGQAPISFGFDVPMPTRAGGATAATALGNQFIVWGEKNEINAGETGANVTVAPGAISGTPDRSTHLVFPNYQVNWVDHAHSTTSNSDGWEYVGYTHSNTASTDDYQTNIKPSKDAAQTIKYWDMAASNYVFTAVSAKPTDIGTGLVKITKTTSDATSVYNKGYSVVVTDMADLSKLYFSDRVDMAPGTNPVTLNFRNSISQVRVGMYETVPGYDVKVTKFYYATAHATSTPAFSDMTSENTTNFVADVPNVSPASDKTSVAGTFTVKYYEKNSANDAAGISNHPTVSFAPTTSSDSKITLSLGTGVYNTKLNETSATPTYDKSAGAFTTVFPQEDNSTNLKLKIDYQLSNTTTGETIDLTAKTAEVPAQYLQWKPNYKYTYIFKISDNDLTPITFDAVQIEAENGNVEYITTVTQPSITTFGVVVDNSNNFKNFITGKDEYKIPAATDKLDIYATILQGSSVLTPQKDNDNKANYVKVYYVAYNGSPSADEQTAHPITELSVANAIEHTGGLITATDITADATTYFTTAPGKVDNVPAEDGTTKTIDALKLTGVKTAGKYAVEIVTYKEVTGLTVGTSVVENYYTLSSETYSKCAAEEKAADGITYYEQIKTYKVITVE